jgi:hypothetical protein
MRQATAGARASRRRDTRRVLLLLALAGGFVLALAGSAWAGAAVNEYTLDLPDAKGKVESPEASPVANPAGLPPDVVSRLTRSPSGKALATIATASSLGAPANASGSNEPGGSAASQVAGDQPSALTAATNAVGDPAALAVLIFLALLGGLLLLGRIQQRSKTT